MPHLRDHGFEASHDDATVVAVHARLQASANCADEPRTRIDRDENKPAGAVHFGSVHACSLAGCSR